MSRIKSTSYEVLNIASPLAINNNEFICHPKRPRILETISDNDHVEFTCDTFLDGIGEKLSGVSKLLSEMNLTVFDLKKRVLVEKGRLRMWNLWGDEYAKMHPKDVDVTTEYDFLSDTEFKVTWPKDWIKFLKFVCPKDPNYRVFANFLRDGPSSVFADLLEDAHSGTRSEIEPAILFFKDPPLTKLFEFVFPSET